MASPADRAALLAAVLADPDADTPRLVYTDCIEETGDEPDAACAEFIRLQCSIAERERLGRVAEGDAAWERAAELADDYGHEWRRRMPSVGGVVWGFGGRGGVDTAWRGFPEVCAESAGALNKARDELAAVAPLDSVGLATAGGSRKTTQLSRSPLLDRLRVVRLSQAGGQAGSVARLLARPEVAAWRGLVLTAGDPEAVRLVAECPRLASLEWLRLLAFAGGAPAPGELDGLFGSPYLPRLAWVEVRTHNGTPLSDRDIAR